uniref:BBS7 beta-propeller domain-containing protein n=1 Tax=Timema bartmani TaxID=61472 RepID=A0A7R9EP62_9NEOP|nr:unnamed protein product [Timema bartmani]
MAQGSILVVDYTADDGEIETNRLVPVLACEDSSLRVLDRSKVMHTIEIDSSPTVLHLYRNDGGDTGDQVLYGTVDGRVGVLQVGRTGVRNRWLVNNELHRGGILCMDCYDITGDGMMDLLIGRQDGSIEVYSIEDDGEDEDGKETRKFGFGLPESKSLPSQAFKIARAYRPRAVKRARAYNIRAFKRARAYSLRSFNRARAYHPRAVKRAKAYHPKSIKRARVYHSRSFKRVRAYHPRSFKRARAYRPKAFKRARE